MVMGHTIFESITPKCNNKAIFIDTGMSKALYGRVSALEILQQEGKTVKIEAVYPNKRKRIFDLNNK